jgi:leader peptidase (prepilin peptidase)/N-methyltransferase
VEIFIFIIGLCVGSFVNVLIDRLPKGEDVFGGRSRCDYCKKNLRWFELIPILSFFTQSGRCLRCHKKLSFQYPIIELVVGIGFVFLFPSIPELLIFLSLLVIFVADLKYEIIPDSMVVFGLLGSMLRGTNYWIWGFGAAAFFLFLFLITRGRGMGFGDVKLVFLLGLMLGFPNIVIALYAAFLTGAAVGIILMLGGKKTLKSHVPFGPFLILGTVFALLYGNQAIQWWYTFL